MPERVCFPHVALECFHFGLFTSTVTQSGDRKHGDRPAAKIDSWWPIGHIASSVSITKASRF